MEIEAIIAGEGQEKVEIPTPVFFGIRQTLQPVRAVSQNVLIAEGLGEYRNLAGYTKQNGSLTC